MLRVENPWRVGYWPGIRGSAARFSFRLPPLPAVDFSGIDAWLAEVFGLDLAGSCLLAETSAAAQPEFGFACRILELSAHLQREARLAVFDAGRIEHIAPGPVEPGGWVVSALVPSLDLMLGRAIASRSVNGAARVLLEAARSIPEGAAVEAAYQRLDREVIQPLRKMSMSGVSTQPILTGAFHRDVPFWHLGAGIYQLGWGRSSRVLHRSVTDMDAAIGAFIANDKYLTAQVLRSAGLPAPVHYLVDDEQKAEEAAARLGWPLVVKPADRERSEGVTVSVGDGGRLLEGFRHASRFSKRVLVEREVKGICYRLMVANGAFLYAVRRRPRSLTGDGIHTVAELIDRQLAGAMRLPLWRRDKPVGVDGLCREALDAQGLLPESVPASGARVALRMFESTEWGGDVEDATGDVHPDNIQAAVAAATLLGLVNAGIDIITPDIGQPWHANGAIINEVNYAPHFGGTTTAKAKMSVFIEGFIRGDGRIPVEVFLGGAAAWEVACKRHRALLAGGEAAFLTSHAKTVDAAGQVLPMAVEGLFQRSRALIRRRDVGVLLLVAQTSEFLQTGSPVDRIVAIHRRNRPGGPAQASSRGKPDAEALVYDLLKPFLSSPTRD